MAGKTRLRIATDVKITNKLQTTLQTLIEGEMEEQDLKALPQHQTNFKAQLEKFRDAFNYLLDAWPSNNPLSQLPVDKLKASVNTLFEEASAQIKSLEPQAQFKDYQAVLVAFNQKLINMVGNHWGGKKAEVIEWLNLAEQYVTSERGRKDLASLSKIECDGKPLYVLQHEKVLPPCSARFIAETLAIQAAPMTALPAWYQALNGRDKALVHLGAGNELAPATLWERVQGIKERFEKLKALDNLTAILIGEAKPPAWFNEFDEGQLLFLKRMARESDFSASNLLTKLQETEREINGLASIADFSESLGHLRQLPEWYLSLSETERFLFNHKVCGMSCKEEVEAGFEFVSSKHRSIPVGANFALSTTTIFEPSGEIVYQSEPIVRSAHIASRDMQEASKEVQERYCDDNIQLVLEHGSPYLVRNHQDLYGKDLDRIDALFLTLISPLVPIKMPDPDLNKQKIKGMKGFNGRSFEGREVELTYPNHPVNIARMYDYTTALTYVSENDKQCNKLLADARLYLQEAFNQLSAAGQHVLGGAVNQQALGNYLRIIVNKNLAYADSLDYASRHDLSKAVQEAFGALKMGAPVGLSDAQSTQIAHALVDWLQKGTNGLPLLDEAAFSACNKDALQLFMQTAFAALQDKDETKGKDSFLLKAYLRAEVIAALSKNQLSLEQKVLLDKHIEPHLKRLIQLKGLIKVYDETLHSGFGTASIFDFNGRELSLSVQEVLIKNCMQALINLTCVSGKDRTAVLLMTMTAMIIFHHCFKRWPRFSDESYGIDRQIFVDLVAQLVMTRHHQQFAGDNSAGANGLKTMGKYFPADIRLRINELAKIEYIKTYGKKGSELFDLCQEDDDAATNNELRRIGLEVPLQLTNLYGMFGVGRRRFSLQDNGAFFVILATQLEDDVREDLLTLLDEATKPSDFWAANISKKKYWMSLDSRPTLISEINTLISKRDEKKLDGAGCFTQILTKCYEAYNRTSSRTPATEEFYDNLWAFMQNGGGALATKTLSTYLETFVGTHCPKLAESTL